MVLKVTNSNLYIFPTTPYYPTTQEKHRWRGVVIYYKDSSFNPQNIIEIQTNNFNEEMASEFALINNTIIVVGGYESPISNNTIFLEDVFNMLTKVSQKKILIIF